MGVPVGMRRRALDVADHAVQPRCRLGGERQAEEGMSAFIMPFCWIYGHEWQAAFRGTMLRCTTCGALRRR